MEIVQWIVQAFNATRDIHFHVVFILFLLVAASACLAFGFHEWGKSRYDGYRRDAFIAARSLGWAYLLFNFIYVANEFAKTELYTKLPQRER
ncbi:MAG: hypothetical protein ACLPKB_01630 [Xanthobacteraceae bacterium]